MAEQQTVTLAQVKINGAGDYVNLLSLDIRTEQNQHGVMTVLLRLDAEKEDYKNKDWAGEQIQAVGNDGKILFSGECTDCNKNMLAQYCEVTLYVKSQSYQTDITKNSRTFQDSGKTFQNVAEEIFSDYGALIFVDKDKNIPIMLVQDKETDWQFIVRIANQHGYQVYTDVTSENLKLYFGNVGNEVADFFDSGIVYAVSKDMQEMRRKSANYGETAGTYHYTQEEVVSSNPYGMAGNIVDGKVITSSQISSDRGVLVNKSITAMQQDALPSSRSMEVESTSSHILSGEVISVNSSTIKVKFDIDGNQSQEEAKELPYENTMSNSFFCMPEEGDRVFGYIDNRGTAIILGCKRKGTVDSFFEKPQEKSITALNNMVHFSEEKLTLSANRKESNEDETKRISIALDKKQGIDIHARGSITVKSDKTIGMRAGITEPQNLMSLIEKFENIYSEGEKTYQTESWGAYDKKEGLEEGWDQVTGSFKNFWKSISFYELRQKYAKTENEIETEEESFSTGTIYMAGETVWLQVGCFSGVIVGEIPGKTVSSIYINADLVRLLGFEKKKGYKKEEESYTDGWEFGLDVFALALDIVATVVTLICPIPAGVILMGASIALSVTRGDYCGALLGCIPLASEIGLAGKIISKLPVMENVVTGVAKGCNFIDDAIGWMTAINVSVSTIEKASTEQMTEKDKVMFFLTWASLITGKVTDKIKKNKNSSGSSSESGTGGSGSESGTGDSSNGSGGSGDDSGGNGSTGIEADVNQTHTNGADPVDMVTGSLTERHTDLRMKDILGDYAVIRTYKSTRENKGRILGSRWMFQFEVSLHKKDNNISVYLPDAHKEQFVHTENGWENLIPGKEKYCLTEIRDGYELVELDTDSTYQFDKAGRILCIYDAYRNRIRYTYQGHLITAITLESGLTLYLSYEGNKLSMLKDSQGREYHYSYEGELLTAVSYPNGGTIKYEYTREGFLQKIHNENGKCYVTNQYDRKGRVVRQNTADGEEYVFFYNDAEKENTLTTMSLNKTVKYHYNRNKLVEKITYDDGTTEERKFDANEKVTWEKDRLGREIHRSYDCKGKLLQETMPDGLCRTYVYDEEGRCIAQEDNAGRKMRYAYDEQGGLREAAFMVTDGVYHTTRFERDSHGRMIRKVYSDGSIKNWQYETDFSHPTKYLGAEGESFGYELDAFGRKMIFHGERGDVYYGYNTNHFVTMIRDEENNCVRYQYDLTGNKVGMLLPEDVAADDGRNTVYTYDLMDHLVGIEDACGSGYIREVNSEGKPLVMKSRSGEMPGIVYSYDSDGRRTHVRYPDGCVLRNYYDACGNLIKQVSPEDYNEKNDGGEGITFAYDVMNRLVGVWDKDGRKIRAITYDIAGRVIKDSREKQLVMSDNTGEELGTLYSYNLAGWKLEEREPVKIENGEVSYRLTTFGYDKRGNCISEKRYLDYQKKEGSSGRVLLIQRRFDKSRRLIQITDSLGSCQEYRYDSQGKMIYERRKIREGVYQEKKYSYTKSGNIESVEVSADGKGSGRYTARTSYRYNRNGKVTTVITPFKNEIRMEYDRCNRLIKQEQIQRDGKYHSTTEFYFDGEGRLCRKMQDGIVFEYGYDIRGRRSYVSTQNGSTQAWLYDKNNRLIKEIGAKEYRKAGFLGKGRSISYENGRVKAIYRMDGGLEKEYTYNEFGEMVYLTEGSGAKISMNYDLSGRRIHAVTEGGAAQSWSYDPWGNINEVTDGNGNKTVFSHDGWGKVTRIDRADGGIETYTYDAAGNLTETVDGNGEKIQFLYNSQNRIEARIDQLGQAEYWNYDAEGRCCRYTDRNGTEIAYDYNMAGSLLSRRSLGENNYGESYGYTPEGRLSYAIGGGMRYDYVYDEFGRLSEKKASGRMLLSYTYDMDGILLSQRDLTGKETSYQYNENGKLAGISDNGNQLASYEYTPEGRLAKVENGSLTNTYSYDTEGSLIGLTTSMDEELLVSNSYRYDNNGNCIYKETLVGATEYSFDSQNRLEQMISPYGTERYSYDYADNRIGREMFENVDGEINLLSRERYVYDKANRLVSSILFENSVIKESNVMSSGNGHLENNLITGQMAPVDAQGIITEYTYDKQGNLLSDGQITYCYDTFNRVEKAECADGQVQINRYDAEGLRHEMEENGKLVQFLYSRKEIVAETEADGNIIRYIRSNQIISSDSESAKTYYHYACDELGSITHIVLGASKKDVKAYDSSLEKANNSEITETDKAKHGVLNHYEYDAFGNTIVCEETVANRFRFTGQQFDNITGQYYLRARFYNPVIARFIQEDNYYGDGLNLYAYCRNNPVRYVDPSGHGTTSAPDKNQDSSLDEIEDFYNDIFDQQTDPNTTYEDYVQDMLDAQSAPTNQSELIDLIEEINNNGGADASEQQALKELAEEFGLDYDSLGVKTKNSGSGTTNTLTDAQKSRLNALENTINDHLTEDDFSGTLRDLQGNPVPNGKGGYFDHLGEMKNSYASLKKIKKALEGSLNNPNLSTVDRELLQEGLDKANLYISKIQELFKPYGGIN